MDRTALDMSFSEFWSERIDTHAWAWAWVAFLGVWIALYLAIDDFSAGIRLFASFIGAVVAFVIYGLSCVALIPLLPLLLLSFFSVWLEACWRVRHCQPYVRPPAPHMPHVSAALAKFPPAVAPRRGGWLLPLAIGLWIGGSWGDDD